MGLSAYVDERTASRLNAGVVDLEWTLILHIALGKDHFVTLAGRYERTCFATSLGTLVRLPGPIRALTNVGELLPEDHALTLPREISRLVGWLTSGTVESVPDVFLTPGEPEAVARIRECLDTGADFDVDNATHGRRSFLALGDCLLQFLAALPDPVIPVNMHERCAQAADRDQAFEILQELPKECVNVWLLVTALLHSIIQTSSPPTHVERLVAKFAMLLLPDNGLSSPASIIGKRAFLRYFIA